MHGTGVACIGTASYNRLSVHPAESGRYGRSGTPLFAEFEKRMPADEARTLGKKIKTRLAEVCPKP